MPGPSSNVLLPRAPLPMSGPVWNAAQSAIRTLRSIGYYDACFVGGVACFLYGNPRTPKDLDILILNTTDGQETIKRRLVASNPSFYLIDSKKAFATYKVLWYRSATYTSIKVDILLPGIMDIPGFPASRIDSSNSLRLPNAPLSVVLLLKLQAWSQHRAAVEWYYSKEQHKDQTDLESLVPIAAQKSIKPKLDLDLPRSFLSEAESRVLEYLNANPITTTKDHWKSIGFTVPTFVAHSSLPKVNVASVVAGEVATTSSRYKVKPLPRTRALYSFGSSRY